VVLPEESVGGGEGGEEAVKRLLERGRQKGGSVVKEEVRSHRLLSPARDVAQTNYLPPRHESLFADVKQAAVAPRCRRCYAAVISPRLRR